MRNYQPKKRQLAEESTAFLFLRLFFGRLVVRALGASAILYSLYAAVMLFSHSFSSGVLLPVSFYVCVRVYP
jgi:hypothetical protein